MKLLEITSHPNVSLGCILDFILVPPALYDVIATLPMAPLLSEVLVDGFHDPLDLRAESASDRLPILIVVD
jgi:hypothetical protein